MRPVEDAIEVLVARQRDRVWRCMRPVEDAIEVLVARQGDRVALGLDLGADVPPTRPVLDANQTAAIVATTTTKVSMTIGQRLPLCLAWALPPRSIVPEFAMVDASIRIGEAVRRPVGQARSRTAFKTATLRTEARRDIERCPDFTGS